MEGTFAPPRMCAMADGDLPPEVVPSEQTHTPADHREHALANAQAHGEDLRLRRQHTPRPWTSFRGPTLGQGGGNPAGSAR